jgi:hypothetical protein
MEAHGFVTIQDNAPDPICRHPIERVMQLRSMLREARKQKLSAGLRARREKGRG